MTSERSPTAGGPIDRASRQHLHQVVEVGHRPYGQSVDEPGLAQLTHGYHGLLETGRARRQQGRKDTADRADPAVQAELAEQHGGL